MSAFDGVCRNKDSLKNVTVFSIISHGDETGIDLIDGAELNIADLEVLSSQLNNLKIVYLGACATGAVNPDTVGENNFATAFKNTGAEVVVGFKIPIYQDELEEWTPHFLQGISEGKTIYDAIDYADAMCVNFKEVKRDNIYVKGNGNIVVCPQY